MTAFKVGDQVTIHNSQTGPEKIATVEAFTEGNRCMVLSDGSKWRADGQRQWRVGSGYYKGPVVERTRPGDLEIVTRRRAIGAIRKFAQDLNMESPLDAAALTRIVERIQEEQAAAPRNSAAKDSRPV